MSWADFLKLRDAQDESGLSLVLPIPQYQSQFPKGLVLGILTAAKFFTFRERAVKPCEFRAWNCLDHLVSSGPTYCLAHRGTQWILWMGKWGNEWMSKPHVHKNRSSPDMGRPGITSSPGKLYIAGFRYRFLTFYLGKWWHRWIRVNPDSPIFQTSDLICYLACPSLNFHMWKVGP